MIYCEFIIACYKVIIERYKHTIVREKIESQDKNLQEKSLYELAIVRKKAGLLYIHFPMQGKKTL